MAMMRGSASTPALGKLRLPVKIRSRAPSFVGKRSKSSSQLQESDGPTSPLARIIKKASTFITAPSPTSGGSAYQFLTDRSPLAGAASKALKKLRRSRLTDVAVSQSVFRSDCDEARKGRRGFCFPDARMESFLLSGMERPQSCLGAESHDGAVPILLSKVAFTRLVHKQARLYVAARVGCSKREEHRARSLKDRFVEIVNDTRRAVRVALAVRRLTELVSPVAAQARGDDSFDPLEHLQEPRAKLDVAGDADSKWMELLRLIRGEACPNASHGPLRMLNLSAHGSGFSNVSVVPTSQCMLLGFLKSKGNVEGPEDARQQQL